VTARGSSAWNNGSRHIFRAWRGAVLAAYIGGGQHLLLASVEWAGKTSLSRQNNAHRASPNAVFWRSAKGGNEALRRSGGV